MSTSQNQIDAMNTMCLSLKKNPLVKDAYVNDWGRFGNFDIFVIPEAHDRYTTNRLKAIVRKMLPEKAMIRDIFGPEPVMKYNFATQEMCREGYNRRFWSFDIDYQLYNPETNRFASQEADAPCATA